MAKDDGKIEREFVLDGSALTVTPMTQYTVSVVTGDVKNAGTDANVFLIIFGQFLFSFLC